MSSCSWFSAIICMDKKYMSLLEIVFRKYKSIKKELKMFVMSHQVFEDRPSFDESKFFACQFIFATKGKIVCKEKIRFLSKSDHE